MDIKFEESLALIRKDRKNFALLPDNIKNNKDFIKQALHKSNGLLGIDIKYISDVLKDDRNFIKEIIHIKPYALAYASERLQNDLELAFIAITQDPFTIEVLDPIKNKYYDNLEQLNLDKDKFLLNQQLEETIPEKMINSNKKLKL